MLSIAERYQALACCCICMAPSGIPAKAFIFYYWLAEPQHRNENSPFLADNCSEVGIGDLPDLYYKEKFDMVP